MWIKLIKAIKFQKSRPLSSCPKPLFSSEAKCSHTNKTHFHEKGFALSLVLKVRGFGTQKWLIWLLSIRCFSYFCQSLWTKSCKVTIQTKTLKEYFHTILVVKTESPMNWVILIFSGQKSCTRIIWNILHSFLHFSRPKDVINHL